MELFSSNEKSIDQKDDKYPCRDMDEIVRIKQSQMENGRKPKRPSENVEYIEEDNSDPS